MNRDQRLSLLAEALHAGWRQGTDADDAPAIHKLIADMPHADWRDYVTWVDYCLGEAGYRPRAVDRLGGLTARERDLLRAVYRAQAAVVRRPGESALAWVPLTQVAAELGRSPNGTSKTAGGLIRKHLLLRNGPKGTRVAAYRLTQDGQDLAGRGPAS